MGASKAAGMVEDVVEIAVGGEVSDVVEVMNKGTGVVAVEGEGACTNAIEIDGKVNSESTGASLTELKVVCDKIPCMHV